MNPYAFWYLRGHTVVLHAVPTTQAFSPTRASALADSRDDELTVIRDGRRQRRPTASSSMVMRRTHAARRAIGVA